MHQENNSTSPHTRTAHQKSNICACYPSTKECHPNVQGNLGRTVKPSQWHTDHRTGSVLSYVLHTPRESHWLKFNVG